MKKRFIVYSVLPVLGLALLLGVGNPAKAFFDGFGVSASPDQIATRQQAMFQNEADILGVSVDEIKNAWAEGKTMQQLIKEKGLTQDQVQARMKEAQTKQLKVQMQALVDKGVITQAQADKRLQVMQTQSNKIGKIGKRGGMMGRGGMMRGFGF